jgi:hypothetical protein
MKLQIPFKDGQPIYPIPEGYTFVDPEEIKTEEVTTKQVTPQTTKVIEDGSDGGDDDKTSQLGGARMDVGGKSFAIGYNFDGSITLTDPNTMESKTYDKNSQITKDAKAVTMGQIVELSKLTPAGIKTTLVSSVADKLGVKIPGSTKIDDIKRKQKEAKNRLNKTMSGVGYDPSTGMSIEDMDTIQAGLEGKGTLTPTAEAPVTQEQARQQTESRLGKSPDRSDVVTASQTQQVDSGSDDPSGGFSDEGFSDSGYGSSGGPGDFNIGGLAGKKKTKVKKMKRGGLASKK